MYMHHEGPLTSSRSCADIKCLKKFNILCKMFIKFPLNCSMFFFLQFIVKAFIHPFMNQVISLACFRDTKDVQEWYQRGCHLPAQAGVTNLLRRREAWEGGKGEGLGKQGKQAKTASARCCIIQTWSWVFFPQREFESHQEDLGRKRHDPGGSCF